MHTHTHMHALTSTHTTFSQMHFNRILPSVAFVGLQVCWSHQLPLLQLFAKFPMQNTSGFLWAPFSWTLSQIINKWYKDRTNNKQNMSEKERKHVRQTDTETCKQDRQTDGQTDGRTDTHTQTDMWARQTDRRTDIQTDRWTDGQTDGQTDRQRSHAV